MARSFVVAPGAALLLAVAGFVVQAPELVSAAAHGCVSPGNDGPNAALTGVVNTYYPATASAASGATTISVGSRIASGTPDIAAGDLLQVIQMQDADISGTNAITYGDGATGRGSTALRSTGLFEYVRAVSAVVAGTVTIAGSGAGNGLVNSYDFSTTVTATHGFRTFQVIRVPQYSSATLGAGLTAAPWDGGVHAGGVLAIDVAGGLNLNAQAISVNQLGFKGALGVVQAGGPDANTDYAVATGRGDHGYKAEGIAGTPHFLYDAIGAAAVTGAADGYPLGDAARGAPGNAGGGGTDFNPAANDQNTGGGGGANGGQGGQGGNSWNSNQPVGGLGGAAFGPAVSRVVLGGGGASGSRNNSGGFASSGGTGGGMVMIRAGSMSGAGTITADGGLGVTPQNDGGGGGGAGGSVLVTVNTGTVNGLTIHADGGPGTDAWPTGPAGTAGRHGPGGGGAGGVIITSNALPGVQATVAGGLHGTTTNGPDAYGSTSGGAGMVLTTTAGAIPGSSSGAECLPLLTVSKTTSTPSVTNTAGGTAAVYSITVSNAINTAAATSVTVSDPLPAGFSYASTGGIVLNGGSTRPATVNPTLGDTTPAFGTFAIPGGGSVVITFTVNIAAGVPDGIYNNPVNATHLDPTRTTALGTAPSSYPGGGPERVTVGSPADIGVNKIVSNGLPAKNTNVTFTVTARDNGPGTATGVQVTDPLPAGLALVSATPSAGTAYSSVTGVWTIGTLANGASATLSIVATVKVTTPVTNVATKTAENQSDPVAANNSASATITPLPGLPNTSAPPGPRGGPTAPEGLAGGPLAGLSLVTALAAMCVAAIASRTNRARFRRRRGRGGPGDHGGTRLVLGGSAVLAGLALGLVSSSQLGVFTVTRSESSVILASDAATSTSGLPAGSQLIGTNLVETTPPKLPVAESFHLATGPITPARLRIPSIGVDGRVDGIGLRGDGSMGVPDNLWTSSWLTDGPRPGQPGKSVIAGHRGIGTPGLFGHLEGVRAGDRIYVSDANGGELVFEVTRIASLDLSQATQVAVFGATQQRELVLVTCYGRYLASSGTYDHRLVVFSSLLPAGT